MAGIQRNPLRRWLSTHPRLWGVSIAAAHSSATSRACRSARSQHFGRRSKAIIKIGAVLMAVIALPFLFETNTGCGFQAQADHTGRHQRLHLCLQLQPRAAPSVAAGVGQRRRRRATARRHDPSRPAATSTSRTAASWRCAIPTSRSPRALRSSPPTSSSPPRRDPRRARSRCASPAKPSPTPVPSAPPRAASARCPAPPVRCNGT